MPVDSECISIVKCVIKCLREDNATHGKFCQGNDVYLDNNTLFTDIVFGSLGVVAPNDTLPYWQEVHRVCEILAEFMKTPEYFSALDLSDDEKMNIHWELRGKFEDRDDDFVEIRTMWTHESLKYEFFKLIETMTICFNDFILTLPSDEAEQSRQTLSGFPTLFDIDLYSDDELVDY